MNALPITSLVTGVFAIAMVVLSMHVSLRRVTLDGVTFGDADDDDLRRKIRAHGNFVEYAPTGLIALALVEFGGAATTLVWCLASLFLFSRLFHPVGMLYFDSPTPRAVAMMAGHAFFLTCGGWLLYTFL